MGLKVGYHAHFKTRLENSDVTAGFKVLYQTSLCNH